MKQAVIGAMALIMLATTHSSVAGAIYKWIDDSGRIHIGDRLPPDGSAVERLSVRSVNTFKGATAAAQDDSVGNVRQKVVIYTTQRCGYCEKAKAFFRKYHIPFAEYDVEKTGKGKRDYKKLNGQGVPIIMIGNQRLNGFNRAYLSAALNRAGYSL